MKLERFDDPSVFRDAATPFLLQNEALTNIIFGVVSDAVRGLYKRECLWLVAQEGETVVGVAMATVPHPISIAHGSSAEAVVELAKYATAWYPTDGDAIQFLCDASAWSSIEKTLRPEDFGERSVDFHQGVYEVTDIVWPRPVSGAMRPAGPDDAMLVGTWSHAFGLESMNRPASSDPEKLLADGQKIVERGGMHLWQDGEDIVSMASSLGDTPTGIRISYVYTPPDLRGRGYASATVAHLTQKHFDCGKERVFLFTDLNNPTSNRIYQAIGYQKAGELNLYKAARA